MLKSASLLYSVFLCTIIATLCAILLVVFSITKLETDKYLITNDFIANSESCFSQFSKNNTNTVFVDKDFDFCTCEISKSSWGLLTLLKQKVFFKTDTLYKTVFAGVKLNNRTALYKTDLEEPLKASGNTKITGNMFVPKGRVERATILGNQSINNPLLLGNIESSKSKLPESINTVFTLPSNFVEISLNELKTQEIVFNSFLKPTYVVYTNVSERLGNINLKGNIVLISENYIEVTKNSKIEDIIIVSPNVKINSGFEGAIQVYASKSIEVEQRATLKYPSALILNASEEEDSNLNIAQNSKVYGTVILNSKTINKVINTVTIANKALVVGTIYCKGVLQLQGVVQGSVYTDKINYKTDYSEYTDVLLNVEINAKVLDSNFVNIPVLKRNKNRLFGVVKEL